MNDLSLPARVGLVVVAFLPIVAFVAWCFYEAWWS